MRTRRSRKNAKKAAIVSLVILLICILFALLHYWENRYYSGNEAAVSYSNSAEPRVIDIYADDEGEMLNYDGDWYKLKWNVETLLLIGLDKYEEQINENVDSYINNQQSDFLLLLVFDHQNKTYTALHINRDTMAEVQQFALDGTISGSRVEQLALSHTYGSGQEDSCENTAKAVSDLLYGAKVDHYISITMDSVAQVNDLVGGVTVKVLNDFSELDPLMVEGQNVTLHGDQALTYVRARRSLRDSSNIQRMERQRQYLGALFQKIMEKASTDEEFLTRLVVTLGDYICSDCTVNKLVKLQNDAMEYAGGDIQTIAGEAVVGEEYMEFYPDAVALKQQVIDLFYEKTQLQQ